MLRQLYVKEARVVVPGKPARIDIGARVYRLRYRPNDFNSSWQCVVSNILGRRVRSSHTPCGPWLPAYRHSALSTDQR